MWDGALILTARGRVPVETLVSGDLVTTTSGRTRRLASARRIASPGGGPVMAVHIAAGGLGDHGPTGDVDLPPECPVRLDQEVVAARSLVNGASIRMRALDGAPSAWALTLEAEDGRDACAFAPFFDLEGFVHQDDAGAAPRDASAMIKRRLLDVAADLGHVATEDPGLHILAGDAVILPRRVRDHRYLFAVPPGAERLRLVSRRWVPAEMLPDSDDTRVLGVCVRRLVLDGREIDLSTVDAGWDKVEEYGGVKVRWTQGSAEIPATGRRALDLELYGFRRYWAEPPLQETAVG